MAGLRHVTTRYLLLLDHDFYVIQSGWIRALLAHVQARRLAFFGSVWHPRWTYQPRGFPSVHFLLIDLGQVPLATLDFRPDFGGNRLDALISGPRLPLPPTLRTLLQVGQFRDTGWRLRARFHRAGLPFECLTPHFDLAGALGAAPPLHRLAQRVLPEGRRPFPSLPGALTSASVLRDAAPSAYACGWEEFFWRGEPFAVHLRQVGRRVSPHDDEVVLDRLLASLT